MKIALATIEGNVVLPRFSTITFEAHDGFIVDIETDYQENVYNAYIRHEKYGDKLFMFGAPMDQQGCSDFIDTVDFSLDDFIPDYRSKYMDYDYAFEGEENSDVQ